MGTTHIIFFFVISILATTTVAYQMDSPIVSAPSKSPQDTVLGGTFPVKDLSKPEIVEIAEYAITEHNKQVGKEDKLEYVKVIKGEYLTVAGRIYRLMISASKNSGGVGNYEAVVYDIPWEFYRNLDSFKPL